MIEENSLGIYKDYLQGRSEFHDPINILQGELNEIQSTLIVHEHLRKASSVEPVKFNIRNSSIIEKRINDNLYLYKFSIEGSKS